MTKRKTLLLFILGVFMSATAARAEHTGHPPPVAKDSSQARIEALPMLLPVPFGITAGLLGANLPLVYPALDARAVLPAIAANGPALHSLIAGLPPRETVFASYLQRLASDYEAQHILYRSVPLSDCSGMFHQLLLKMKEAFPAFAYPAVAEARSSRALARWYYDKGSLHIIDEAAGSGDLIRPGAVMFFGQVGKKYNSPSIDQLTTYGAGIMHIGTVVEVEKDEQGKVIAYTMFHARGRGKPASHTRHYLRHPGNPGLPAFGNWRQQWVAIAYIDTEKI